MAELSEKQQQALDRLAETPGGQVREVRWDRDFKSPRSIGGVLSAESGAAAESIAREFLEKTRDLVDLPDGLEESMELAHATTDRQGYRHVTFRQVLNGVPVVEGSVQVHISPEGRVTGYRANRLTQVDPDVTPVITQEQAMEIARQRFQEDVSTAVPPESELVLFRARDDRVRLCWNVRLFNDTDVATYHYYLDAKTGELLYVFNDQRHFAARRTYTARNLTDLPGQLIVQDGDESNRDEVAWSAHANAKVVYDYYFERFGRDSYDGEGAELKSTVHYGTHFNNAFWMSSLKQMVYGDGDGTQFSPLSRDLDIVAHELTHAVTSSSARFIYAEEAGALDESFADFFAIMATNGDPVTNWLMGEQSFTPGRPGDALRDISNPPASNQPDHTAQQFRLGQEQLPECNTRSAEYNDNGWVHYNSGIPNKAAYLMVAGGTHGGVTVKALGKADTEQVMYLALTVFLESAMPTRWSFNQARIASIDACRQLFPSDQAKLASVTNAWAAVGVGEIYQPPEPEPEPAPQPEPESEPIPEPGTNHGSTDQGLLASIIRLILRLIGGKNP